MVAARGKDGDRLAGRKTVRRGKRKEKLSSPAVRQQAVCRRQLLLAESEDDAPLVSAARKVQGEGESTRAADEAAFKSADPPSQKRACTLVASPGSDLLPAEMEVVQQAARVHKGKMVLVEEDSEEWESPYKNSGSGLDDSDATLSDGAGGRFEIRARVTQSLATNGKPAETGRVRQVVQALEAGKETGGVVDGEGKAHNDKSGPPLLNEYGTNTELLRMGGRKRSWEDISGEVEENPTMKKLFVEDMEEGMLKSVEVASRKWPQLDK
ncbi:unnamed protein product [Linum trigynum]|uniref:Uncharacterized protein n=1 Tax=Linum trigynum TaxID=586398 RepID=A0AAV2DBZ7_9ROSI